VPAAPEIHRCRDTRAAEPELSGAIWYTRAYVAPSAIGVALVAVDLLLVTD
jgi:hypothetical protein